MLFQEEEPTSVKLDEIKNLEDKNEVKLYPKRGISLEKGQGSFVFDTEGKKYLDFMTNLGVSILGYSNPEITKAITEQLYTLSSNHQTFYSSLRAEFIQELLGILPKDLNQVIFTNSGTESIEAALKLAIMATGKNSFVGAESGYHGKTLGSLSVTGQEKYKYDLFSALEVAHVPFNDLESLEKAITPETAGVILEPIQGEAGIIIPDTNYLKGVKQICGEKGVLLILDEIQTAIRTGSWLVSTESGITPDILCLSKSFSYGIPFGVAVTTGKYSKLMPKGSHGGTFAGNPLACRAAIEVIKKIKAEDLLKNAQKLGAYFLEELKKIKHPSVVEVKGKGLMIGMLLEENPTPYLKAMQDKGLIAGSSTSNTIRFLPPISTTKDEIDQALKIVKEVFNV